MLISEATFGRTPCYIHVQFDVVQRQKGPAAEILVKLGG